MGALQPKSFEDRVRDDLRRDPAERSKVFALLDEKAKGKEPLTKEQARKIRGTFWRLTIVWGLYYGAAGFLLWKKTRMTPLMKTGVILGAGVLLFGASYTTVASVETRIAIKAYMDKHPELREKFEYR